MSSSESKFYSFRVVSYTSLTALLFLITFSPFIFSILFFIKIGSSNLFWILVFSPVVITIVYMVCWMIFVFFHSKFIVPFFLPSLNPGKYPVNSKKTKLLVIRLSADQTARITLIPLDFMPLVVNRYLRPYFLRSYGVKLGRSPYIARDNKIDASSLIKIGDNVIVGQLGLISCHVIVKGELVLNKVEVGNNVTIGGYALIGPGTILEDDVIIGAGAIVPNKHIKKGSTYYAPAGRLIPPVDNDILENE